MMTAEQHLRAVSLWVIPVYDLREPLGGVAGEQKYVKLEHVMAIKNYAKDALVRLEEAEKAAKMASVSEVVK
jgi:hypothetical protein